MRAKLIRQFLNENFKLGSHEYIKFHLNNGDVYASREGILADDHVFVSWYIIKKLLKKFGKI